MTTPIQQSLAVGQSIWYDGIRRSLLTSGELEHMVGKNGLRGMTSNPSIFDAAIAGSSDYADAIAELRGSDPTDDHEGSLPELSPLWEDRPDLGP